MQGSAIIEVKSKRESFNQVGDSHVWMVDAFGWAQLTIYKHTQHVYAKLAKLTACVHQIIGFIV